jgi:hypothetical protein
VAAATSEDSPLDRLFGWIGAQMRPDETPPAPVYDRFHPDRSAQD